MRKALVGCLLLLFLQGCSVIHRDKVFSEFNTLRPVRVGVLVDYKSILERPAGFRQFSIQSIFPDTIDKGSNWAYKKNSSEAKVVSEREVNNLFAKILSEKGYEYSSLDLGGIHSPDSIGAILREGRIKWPEKVDAVLFIDFSDMFNRYFAGKGVAGNPGHALYFRYALFSLESCDILVRRETTLHPDFYFKSKYALEEMRFELLKLLEEELIKEFPEALVPSLNHELSSGAQEQPAQYVEPSCGYSTVVPLDWSIHSEYSDDTVSRVSFGLPRIWSDLEQQEIENSIAVIAHRRSDLSSVEDVVELEGHRHRHVLISSTEVELQFGRAQRLITEIRGLQYKSLVVYRLENGVGYVFIFTATEGTYDRNRKRFIEFLSTVEFFPPEPGNAR